VWDVTFQQAAIASEQKIANSSLGINTPFYDTESVFLSLD
jgi:hypothetical protein